MSQTNVALDADTAPDVDTIIDAIAKGLSIGEIAGMEPEALEAGYNLAFNLYNAGNFKDAETLFGGLCLYHHRDERFWIGLGGCRQALGNFTAAIDAYDMACVAGTLKNPAPSVHAGLCYLKLGDTENARALFDAALELGDENNPTHRAYHEKARAMLQVIDEGATS
ncbi:MAG: SycD/LcrH family type III secretion system chaperone [Candidatus Accumulibacter sp.]|jgi:type III secretion system low calcium response chaperone LcrH/SycD|nr:SycD/LcrH family type III secretion system chaperone [Accumulibacter sp.]